MTNIQFIAKQLNKDNLPKLNDCNCKCAFSGQQINKGILKKVAIKKTFTDYTYLKYNSDYISTEAYLCIAPCIKTKKGLNALRSYSYIVTEKNLTIIKHNEYMNYILNPPDPPFIFVITFANKKHTSFKSVLNNSKENFTITTDIFNIKINKKIVTAIYPIIQKWYSVIPEKKETKQKPTYFTKGEILNGCIKFHKIRSYGIKEYLKENQIIEKYRKTNLLELLTFCLEKGE